MLALVGAIAVTGWLRSDNGETVSSLSAGPADVGSDSAEPAALPAAPVSAPEAGPEEVLALADPEAPHDTMREYLLSTPEANRNRILRLAVTGEGYECSSVKSAGLVGNSGADWRAHCGDALVYWVVVDEFSRFSVAPIPYGDLDIPAVEILKPAPESITLPLQPLPRELRLIEPPETR